MSIGVRTVLKFLVGLVARLSLAVLACIVLLVGAEFFLRWYYNDAFTTALGGGNYLTRRSSHLFQSEMNQYGLRGKTFELEGDGKYRIVVMGDSFTYGQGVYPAEKRFTEQLSQLLRSEDVTNNFTVLNVGKSGDDLPQYNNSLPFILSTHPDFLLYQWFVNDMDITSFEYRQLRLKLPRLISNKRLHAYLWEHSILYFLLYHRFSQFTTLSGKQKSYTDYLVEKYSDPTQKPALLSEKFLEKLILSVKESGIPFGIVMFPSFALDLQDYQLKFLHDRVLDTCKKHNVDCLDLYSIYKDLPHTSLWANPFDPHPSELAHTLAAEAILQHFGPLWHQQEKQHLLSNRNLNKEKTGNEP